MEPENLGQHAGGATPASQQQQCSGSRTSKLKHWASAAGATLRRQRAASTLVRRLKVTGSIIRQHPSTLAAPLIMLSVMLAVGCWGVTWGANKEVQQSKQQAASFAGAFMSNYRNDVLQVSDALVGVTAGIRQYPASFEYLKTSVFPTLVPDMLKLTKSTLLAMYLVPQGRILAQYVAPLLPLGTNVLAPRFPDRPTVISAITSRALTMLGPFHGVPAPLLVNTSLTPEQRETVAKEWVIVAIMPVFVRPLAQNSSATLPLDVPPPVNCTECNVVVDGEVFWGVVGGSFPIGDYLQASTFHDAGYRFRMDVPQVRNQFAASPQNIVGRSDKDVIDPVSASAVMDATNFTWTLYVSPECGTWRPDWEVALMVTVVITSVALATMQFLALLAWRQHQLLLASLLPRAVIQRLQLQHDYKGGAVDEESFVASGTPAETMLRILTTTMQGDPPDIRDAMMVRTTLMRGADVYQPLDLGVKIKASKLDSDVARALARQLDNTDAYLSTPASADGSDPNASFTVSKRQPSIINCLDVQYDNLHTVLSALMSPPSSSVDSLKPSWDEGLAVDCFQDGVRGCTERPAPGVATPGGVVCATDGTTTRDPAMLLPPPPVAAASVPPLLDDAARSMVALAQPVQEDADGKVASSMAAALVPRQLQVEQVERQLQTANQWEFDAMELAACTNGHALSTLGFYVLSTTGLMATFKLKGAKVARFLSRVEALYLSNPYHSATHAADVLQTMHVLMQRGGLAGQYADPLGQLACYFAAVVHDLGHLGFTNDFLVVTSHNLAVLYNDKAPQENHHVSQAFELLRQPGMDFLAPLTREQRARLRRMVIELVLATDMKQHFQVVSQFKTLHQAQIASNVAESVRATPRRPRRSLLGGGTDHRRQSETSSPNQPLPQSPTAPGVEVDEAGKLLTLQFSLKCADLGHLTSPLPVHIRWVASLEEEFFRQGDAEKAAGLPLSPLCDRSKPGITKSQVGFFSIVVLPQFQALAAAMPAMQPLHDAMTANYRHWQQMEKVQAVTGSVNGTSASRA